MCLCLGGISIQTWAPKLPLESLVMVESQPQTLLFFCEMQVLTKVKAAVLQNIISKKGFMWAELNLRARL